VVVVADELLLPVYGLNFFFAASLAEILDQCFYSHSLSEKIYTSSLALHLVSEETV